MRAEREPSGGEGGGGGFHDLIRRGNPGRPSVVLDYSISVFMVVYLGLAE